MGRNDIATKKTCLPVGTLTHRLFQVRETPFPGASPFTQPLLHRISYFLEVLPLVWRFDQGRVSGLRAGLPPGVGWVVHVLQIHLGLHWCVISNSYAVLSLARTLFQSS